MKFGNPDAGLLHPAYGLPNMRYLSPAHVISIQIYTPINPNAITIPITRGTVTIRSLLPPLNICFTCSHLPFILQIA